MGNAIKNGLRKIVLAILSKPLGAGRQGRREERWKNDPIAELSGGGGVRPQHFSILEHVRVRAEKKRLCVQTYETTRSGPSRTAAVGERFLGQAASPV